MRWYRFTEYQGDDEDEILEQAQDFLDRLKDYLFLTDGNVREAIELMKESGELGEGEGREDQQEQDDATQHD